MLINLFRLGLGFTEDHCEAFDSFQKEGTYRTCFSFLALVACLRSSGRNLLSGRDAASSFKSLLKTHHFSRLTFSILDTRFIVFLFIVVFLLYVTLTHFVTLI